MLSDKIKQQVPSTTPSNNSSLISDNVRYPSKMNKGYISYDEVLNEYNNFDGSPFLHKKEIVVDLIHTDGHIKKNVRVLYDLYNYELIIKGEDEENLILDQVYYTGFIYDNNGVIENYQRIYDGDKTMYCKELYKNKDFTFCVTEKIRISDAPTPIPGVDPGKRKFVAKKQYYVVTKKATNLATLKNEKVVNYLPNKYKSQVQKLKRKLKIRKLKKEKDYVRLMNSFSS